MYVMLENKDVLGARFLDTEPGPGETDSLGPGMGETEPGWIRVSRGRKVNRMSGERKLIL